MPHLNAIYPDGSIKEIASKEEALVILRHSTSHLLAAAVLELFPGTHLGIGPATAEGFYYDFEKESNFNQEDLSRIEDKMREIAGRHLPFEPVLMDKPEAIDLFQNEGEHLKVELIQERAGDRLSCYRLGKMLDFCRGPHVANSDRLKNFRLLSNAGSYWKGDEKNLQLQRIYGTTFFDPQELEDHLQRLEEARKRDHRKLGKELELFSVFEIAGPGFIYWLPKGTTLRTELESFLRSEHLKRGYQYVTIPHVARNNLFKTSGHYDYYRQNMYILDIEDEEYVIKPMNCPGHILIYKSSLRSYRDLPLRFTEFGTVYRYEKSGTLHGMLRVRGFTQDDAHIFCSPDQAYDEVVGVIDFARFVLSTFGFQDYEIDLSVRDPEQPGDYAGSSEDWDHAEDALRRALDALGLRYTRREGEAVFYGPKIDMKLIDALGRGWQATTIQFDFNLPQRFDVTYIGSDSNKHRVIMIHRALFGSLERFVGVLIEHFAGAFPVWMAPVQVVMIPISEKHHDYARKLQKELIEQGFRSHLDDRNEKMGYKIREAQMQKVPYMLIMGDKEVADGNISVRNRFEGDLGRQSLQEFTGHLAELIRRRAIRP